MGGCISSIDAMEVSRKVLRRATAFNPSFANTYAKKSIPIPGARGMRSEHRDVMVRRYAIYLYEGH